MITAIEIAAILAHIKPVIPSDMNHDLLLFLWRVFLIHPEINAFPIRSTRKLFVFTITVSYSHNNSPYEMPPKS
jgi:hypothetical protein